MHVVYTLELKINLKNKEAENIRHSLDKLNKRITDSEVEKRLGVIEF